MRAFCFATIVLPALSALALESPWPEKLEANRYDSMREQSPFALATVVAPPPVSTEGFAANWELTGLAKLRDANGVEQDYVAIRSRDRRVAFSILGNEVKKEGESAGVSIGSIEWSPQTRKSSVQLKKGSELAKVEFGQEVAAPPPMPGMNGAPGARGFGLPNPAAGLPGAFGGAPNPLAPLGNTGAANRGMNTRPNLPLPNAAPAAGSIFPPGANTANPYLNPGAQTTATSPFPPTVTNNNLPNTGGNAVPPPRVRVVNTRP